MKIKSEEITITLSNEECRDIAYHIKRSLKASIDDHYSYLQQADLARSKQVFEQQERLDMIKMKGFMMAAEGLSSEWMEEELWRYLEEQYKKHHPNEKEEL